MAKRTGILLEGAGFVSLGDDRRVAIGDTLQQNEWLILAAEKGELKEMPLMGAGVAGLLNDDDTTDWKWRIAEELTRDGLKVKTVAVKDGNILLEADYEG